MTIRTILVSLILLTAGTSYSATPLPGPYISGQLYWNHNGNNLNFPVTVHLYDGNCNLVATTVSADNGWYNFWGGSLPNGNYVVKVHTFTAGTTSYRGCERSVAFTGVFSPQNDIAIRSGPCKPTGPCFFYPID